MQTALATFAAPLTPDDLAKQFQRGNADQIAEILEALTTIDQARKLRGGTYGV